MVVHPLLFACLSHLFRFPHQGREWEDLWSTSHNLISILLILQRAFRIHHANSLPGVQLAAVLGQEVCISQHSTYKVTGGRLSTRPAQEGSRFLHDCQRCHPWP